MNATPHGSYETRTGQRRRSGASAKLVARFCLAAAAVAGTVVAADQDSAPPRRLSDTGLYVAGTKVVRSENLPFSPQYPLWSDGATKRRWLYLPPGASIDASRADAWEFPPGTRLWKEFSHGRPVETRFIERRVDGSWAYAVYIWNAEGSDAALAPAEKATVLTVHDAPRGRYVVPSQADCRNCHEAAPVPVLGASALQLSSDRDPLAPHADPVRPELVDLRGLVARGLVRNLPLALLERAPRIAAASPTARAALGYLHGNCGHCHNDAGPLASLELVLLQEAAAPAGTEKALHSLVGRASRYRASRADATAQRIVPGRQDASTLVQRMRSRNPFVQMPPLGTQLADAEGIALIESWIAYYLQEETHP